MRYPQPQQPHPHAQTRCRRLHQTSTRHIIHSPHCRHNLALYPLVHKPPFHPPRFFLYFCLHHCAHGIHHIPILCLPPHSRSSPHFRKHGQSSSPKYRSPLFHSNPTLPPLSQLHPLILPFTHAFNLAFNQGNIKKLLIDRSNLTQSSSTALRQLAPHEFRPRRAFRIEFVGECAYDLGGVFCDWHSATSKALAEVCFLHVTNSFGEPTGLYRLNPALNVGSYSSCGSSSSSSSNANNDLWLLGCILGLSVSEKNPTGISITPAFAKRLLQV